VAAPLFTDNINGVRGTETSRENVSPLASPSTEKIEQKKKQTYLDERAHTEPLPPNLSPDPEDPPEASHLESITWQGANRGGCVLCT
jgi:hypothetical protein